MKFAPHHTILPLTLLLIAACAAEPEQAGVANPAATFCIDQGGAYTLESGDTPATCTLSDGRVVDAWDYFRANA